MIALLADAWLPALFAGLIAIVATVAIERLGGVVGGFIGTLPSTIVPASLGIHAQTDAGDFARAMAIVPLGMLVNGLFLWLWRALPPRLPPWPMPRRLVAMLVLTLSVWLALATANTFAADLALRSIAPAALGLAGTLALIGVGVVACWRKLPAPRGGRRVGPITLLSRGLMAALAIGCAVALAATGSALLGGIASVFPAIFLTTMASLWWSQGEAVQSGAVGPMILGSASVSGFALGALLLFPLVGPLVGSIAAWVAAVLLVSAPGALWVQQGSGHIV